MGCVLRSEGDKRGTGLEEVRTSKGHYRRPDGSKLGLEEAMYIVTSRGQVLKKKRTLYYWNG